MKQLTVPTKGKFLNCDTFIIGRASNGYYQEGENYNVLQEANQIFIDTFQLVSKRTIHFSEITSEFSFLICDLEPEDFKRCYKDYTAHTMGLLDVMVFCKSRYVRLFDIKNTDQQNLKSLSNTKTMMQ